LADAYGVACEPSVEAMVDRSDIDAVFISTPHSAHAAHAVEAAKAGKHILVDKPMAASVGECDQIIHAAAQSKVNLMIMFGQRFRMVNKEAYRLIQDGAIGRIRVIHAYALNSGGLAALPAWQSSPENLGTFFGHGVHSIDLVRWFTGAEIATVSAVVQREAPSDNEVSTMATLGLDDESIATVWVSWAIPSPGFPNTGFGAKVVGDKGALDLDAYGTLRLCRNNEWNVIAEQAPIDFKGKGMLDPVRLEAYAAQGDEFLNSIREERRPSVTGEDGRAAVAVALAAYRSATDQKTISMR
jgi:predicted dehydrogenase